MTTTTLARCQHTNRSDHQVGERLETTALRDTIIRDETWNCSGCGGWLHQQTEVDAQDATKTIVTFPLRVTEYAEHPTWCDAHAGHSDGSGDWHESAGAEVAGLTTALTTGVYDRTAAVLTLGSLNGELSLTDARALGERLIALCDAAEADR